MLGNQITPDSLGGRQGTETASPTLGVQVPHYQEAPPSLLGAVLPDQDVPGQRYPVSTSSCVWSQYSGAHEAGAGQAPSSLTQCGLREWQVDAEEAGLGIPRGSPATRSQGC